ncbi:MAG: hypothetical protein FJ265_21420 [Planctomycetes bacterium]|nr:hypothetical protein [Planctomycetota bacterium]
MPIPRPTLPALSALPALLALLALFAAACSHTIQFGRTGAPFDEAFPDPSVLVTTDRPAAVRQTLATTPLPATTAHHERLLALLRSRPSISAAHLLLLVEAVSLPESSYTVVDDRPRAYAVRGEGEFAPVADRLLTEGADKLVDVDRRLLGELLGRSHGDAALAAVADRFLPALDDGSLAALREILDGTSGSPATVPFLVRYLLPRGRLDTARGLACVPMLAFDDARVALVAELAPRTTSLPVEQFVQLVRTMAFDEGRGRLVGLLAEKAAPLPAEAARAVVASFTFDAGRHEACARLAERGGLELAGSELVALVRLFAFDDGRVRCAQVLAPRLRGTFDGRTVRALLGAFAFDAGRLGALRAVANRLGELSAAEQRDVLATFAFDDHRLSAARLLR